MSGPAPAAPGSLARLRAGYQRFLEGVVIVLMVTLSIEVVAGIVFRALGNSLAWYDEVASILLAWLTFYGAALAALKRAHIGFPGLVRGLPPQWRVPMVLFGEACVVGFFALVAWVGVGVLEVLATDHLVSLPAISVAWVQSVIPVSALMIIIAELINLPDALAEARGHKAMTGGVDSEASH